MNPSPTTAFQPQPSLGAAELGVRRDIKTLYKAMSDSLRPFKTFFGKTWLCVILAVLPIIILEGMWSDPDQRELARRLDGSTTMLISFAVYLLVIYLIWRRWVSHSKS
jgi:hypothetical protein